jgi:hypothetical protein
VHRLTYVLLILVLGTLGFSLGRHRNLPKPTIAAQKDQQQKQLEHIKKVNERFPTAEYNLDSADPQKIAKKKRYNDGHLVKATVNPETVETEFFPEPHITFPALPLAESDLVVVGTIGGGQAHLSENKRNVFSEFTLIVEEVFNSKSSGLSQGSVLTIDRIGGHVKYPNGQKVLYRIAGLNMPQIGSRYLFFLTSKHNKADLSILTGYELTQTGAVPLDEGLPEVTRLTGTSEKDILQRVRDLIAKSSN